MVNIRLLNKSGKLVKIFNSISRAYKYAALRDIENFSIHTTLN